MLAVKIKHTKPRIFFVISASIVTALYCDRPSAATSVVLRNASAGCFLSSVETARAVEYPCFCQSGQCRQRQQQQRNDVGSSWRWRLLMPAYIIAYIIIAGTGLSFDKYDPLPRPLRLTTVPVTATVKVSKPLHNSITLADS
jgi:hypothetical protein